MARAEGPKIVICQAGHIHSGACDPFAEVIPIARAAGAWVHIDGAFGLWAVLQALGRQGVRELIDRHCACAVQLAEQLRPVEGIEVVNDVVLNQVALRFGDARLESVQRDQLTQVVIEVIQQENHSFVSGSSWQGEWIMRVSVISQRTGSDGIEQLAEAIVAAWQGVQGA